MFSASTKSGKNPTGGTPDAQFNYVTMLLHGDGTNGAQNNTFIDSSTNAFSITRNGNTTQGSFSPYGSNWSNFFDGNGDYLTCSVSVPATGAFTVEMFVFPTSTAGYQLLFSQFTSGNAGSLQILWDDTTDKFTVNIGTGTVLTSSSTYALNTWHHLAITRDGSNNMTMWVNGASAATATNSTSILQTTTFIATRSVALDGYFNGYISNLRVTNTAVYTTSFTPSTTPLTAISGTQLLTCQSNRFVDNSSSPKTITVNGNISVQRFNPFGTSTAYSTSVIGGSGYFDGSGDYLTASSTNTANFGTADFIVSAWFYSTSTGSYQKIFDNYNGNNNVNPTLLLNIAGAGKISWYAGQSPVIDSSSTYIPNTWNYVVVSRVSSTTKMFLNGTQVGSVSDTRTYVAGNANIGIGGEPYSSGGAPMVGYITDLQVVKGSGVTSSTVPTAPVSASGSTLHLSMTNGAIIDNAMMNDLETVGNAQISTSVVKYGTGSLKFDGTGDYLKGPPNPWLALGANDYTIEMWVNFNSVSTSVLFGNIDGSGNGNWAFFYNSTAAVLRLLLNNSAVILSSSSWTPSTGTWYHIAICRASGTYRFFINGTVTGSGSNSTDIDWGGITNSFYVGSANDGTLQLNGYIDDLRITKGYARYTTTFTPPTAAFPNTGPI